ncbi:hypothetical protein A8990_10440 [Paenibacillus taihuensis]|uniref:Uncharacterized protein n=1 Tax=Paenibacillus taihuensis TaxID=1156355 RepID=A0A3D9SCB1_9BACL|nr:hypothetical protein A8990_10440 [Paenibacillus taihuensis]
MNLVLKHGNDSVVHVSLEAGASIQSIRNSVARTVLKADIFTNKGFETRSSSHDAFPAESEQLNFQLNEVNGIWTFKVELMLRYLRKQRSSDMFLIIPSCLMWFYLIPKLVSLR